MNGTLGHFWTELTDVYNFDRSNDGYVRLVDDTIFHIDTLRTKQYLAEFGHERGASHFTSSRIRDDWNHAVVIL